MKEFFGLPPTSISFISKGVAFTDCFTWILHLLHLTWSQHLEAPQCYDFYENPPSVKGGGRRWYHMKVPYERHFFQPVSGA